MRIVQRSFSQQMLSVSVYLLLGVVTLGSPPPQRTSGANLNQDSGVVASGEVRPIRYIKLTSDVGGRVREILVKIGDRVADGQALVLIEKPARQPKTVKQYSPLGGIVADISTAVGDTVGRRKNPLMTIADMAQINVEIAVNESEIKLLRLGQPARVLVDAFSEKELRGIVRKIRSLRLQSPGPKEFIITIELTEIPAEIRDRLLPGMSATAWVKVRG